MKKESERKYKRIISFCRCTQISENMIMSYSQFAEEITSFGQGTGIPVTI